jgi:putative heme-binding domain-containing protein
MTGRVLVLLSFTFLGTGFAQDPPAPPVMLLAPGIVARELPVKLTNINNVRYAPDGRLFAVGYDGRVHVLTDSDGDGLEDRVTAYWDRKGELLTPLGMEIAPEGVYLASRGRISLLRDADKDGVADGCETVVSGWVQERHNNNNRNDASGVAIDAEGNLYFCLGCSDYSNPFLVDKEGQAHYDLKSERGTILKVSPDRKRREIVSTGIRFAVSLAFNKAGDLFATDQEGDTWFPGGNPLDEFLHILPGRHYGFPYRHPKHLPDVVDEPCVAEFGPQHQSSCGFCFNEARPGRERFGPPEWEGDAFVTGFSRGKLWRVALAKTRAGYVGRPVLLASFQSLAVDVALSPKGDLVVACHGGKPDWGSGPNGEGKLWKLSWTGRSAAQPVIAWPSGPLEVNVAFDRPVAGDVQGAMLDGGEFVKAGDRFETIRPGYKVVAEQQRSPRHPLRVHSIRPSEDRRTLTLLTGAHPWRAGYGLSVPSAGVEVDYDLGGLEAEWTPEGAASAGWKGWMPSPTLAVTQGWTRGSAVHEALAARWKQSGKLTMQGQLFPPAGGATLVGDSAAGFDLTCGGAVKSSERTADGRHRAELALPVGSGPLPIRIVLRTGGGDPDFELAARNPNDPHLRPLRPESFGPSWAPVARPPKPSVEKKTGALAQGDPVKGRAVFFGAEARCSVCHMIRGEGGKVAPDLSPSAHRDPEAVLRDIVEPNAAINPEFVSYLVELTNGDTLSGVVLTQDAEKIVLVDAEGKERPLAREKIRQFRSSAISLMPDGFKKLGDEKLRDLVAFLCANPDPRK